MKPFDNFCQVLFEKRDNNWFAVLNAALQQKGISAPATSPEEDEARALVEKLPEQVLLELLYRFSYYHPDNIFTALSQYKIAHPERNQFVNEFLQNADDADATAVTFEFWPNEVRVFNNGRAFTHENLYAICSFHESDKDPRAEKQIGKFGMGFKTVFRISETPEIYTFDKARGFQFPFRFFEPGRINTEYFAQLKTHAPFDLSDQVSERVAAEHHLKVGYILPEPVQWEAAAQQSQVVDEPRGSFFRLPLRRNLDQERWNEARIEELVPSDVFLFLEHVNLLRLVERRGAEQGEVSYEKKERQELAKLPEGTIERLLVSRTAGADERWLLFKSNPEDVDSTQYDDLDIWSQQRLPERLVWTIAVKLDGSGRRLDFVDPMRSAGGKLYAFLPVKNPELGLNLHVNAPFNLTNNRADLSEDRFNRDLVERVSRGVGVLLNWLRAGGHDGFKQTLFHLLPSQDDGTEILAPLRRTAVSYRDTQPILPAHDGELAVPAQVVHVDSQKDLETSVMVLGDQPAEWFLEDAPPGSRLKVVLNTAHKTQSTRHLNDLIWQKDARLLNLYPILRFLANPEAVTDRSREGYEWYAGLRSLTNRYKNLKREYSQLLNTPFLPAAHDPRSLVRPSLAARWQGDLADRDLVLKLWPEEPIAHADVDVWAEKSLDITSLVIRRRVLEELLNETPLPERERELLVVLDRAAKEQPLNATEIRRLRAELRLWTVVSGRDERAQVTVLECTAKTGLNAFHSELREALRILDEEAYPPEAVQVLQTIIVHDGAGLDVELVVDALRRVSSPSPGLVAWCLDLLLQVKQNRTAVRSSMAETLQLKVRGQCSCKPAVGVAVEAFPDGLSWTRLSRLVPEALCVDLGHYIGALGADTTDVAARLERELGVSREYDPPGEALALAASRVQDSTDSWALMEYLSALARSRWHDRHRGELALLQRRLGETPWLPLQGQEKLADAREVLFAAPNDTEALGQIIYESESGLPCLDLGVTWKRNLEFVREVNDAQLMQLRGEPSLQEAALLLKALVSAARQLSATGRNSWERLATSVRWLCGRHGELASAVEHALSELMLVSPEHQSIRLRPDVEEQRRTILTPDAATAQLVARFFNGRADVHVEPNAEIRDLLCEFRGVPTLELVDDFVDLRGDPDLACRLLLSLGEVKQGEVLTEQEVNLALAATRVICEVDPTHPWFDRLERVVLTHAPTLEAAETGIYLGSHRLVGQILGDKKRHMHRLHRGLADLPGVCNVLGVIDDTRFTVGPGCPISVELRYQGARPITTDVGSNECDPVFRALVIDLLPEDMKAQVAGDPHQGSSTGYLVDVLERTLSLEVGDGRKISRKQSLDSLIDTVGGDLAYLLIETREIEWRKRKAEKEQDLAALKKERLREDIQEETRKEQPDTGVSAQEEIKQFREENLELLAAQLCAAVPGFRETVWRKAKEEGKGFGKYSSQITSKDRMEDLRRHVIRERGYTTTACIFRELIQNVEDAYASQPDSQRPDVPWASFVFKEGEFHLVHAGRRFNKPDGDAKERKDVERLLSLGGSEKTKKKTEIGRFGLGFKAVFLITDDVVVLSHPYYFKITSLVLPEWYSDYFDYLYEGTPQRYRRERTAFLFVVSSKREEAAQAYRQVLTSVGEHLEPPVSHLLFLKYLREITVEAPGGRTWILHRREKDTLLPGLGSKDTPVKKVTLGVETDGGAPDTALPGTGTYLVVTSRRRIDFSAHAATGLQWVDFALAYRLVPDGPGVTPVDESLRRIALYLPTEEPHGLPFMIHGAFATDAGRARIGAELPAFNCNWEIGRALGELHETALKGLFKHWKNNPGALKTIYQLIPPIPAEGAPRHILDPLYDAFPQLVESQEEVLLTRDGQLVGKREMARGGTHLIGVYEAIRGVWSGVPRVDFLAEEAASALERAGITASVWRAERLVGHVFSGGGKILAGKVLFAIARYHMDRMKQTPDGLERHNLDRECEALLRALGEVHCVPCQDGDLRKPEDSLWTCEDLADLVNPARSIDHGSLPRTSPEVQWLKKNLQLSDVLLEEEIVSAARQVEDSNGQGCLKLLMYVSERWSEYRYQKRRLGEATLESLKQLASTYLTPEERTAIDEGFWAALYPERLKKAREEEKEEPKKLLTDEDRHELIRGLYAWWTEEVSPEDREQYTLNSFGPILGLGDHVPNDEHLRDLLRRADGDSRRLWFRVLAISTVIQTGRRLSEGRKFLTYFGEHGYFERLYEADGDPAFHEIVHESLADFFDSRGLGPEEWTPFWRLLYDFEKEKILIRKHELVECLHEVAKEQPLEITGFFKLGKLPGQRPDTKGLGQSIGKQAFFVTREMLRLGVWGDDQKTRESLQEAAYYPSRHTRRFVSRQGLLATFSDPERYLGLDHYYNFSKGLGELVKRAGVDDHFQLCFDVPFMHFYRERCSRCHKGSEIDCPLPCAEQPSPLLRNIMESL